ncbi:MAG: curlin, partial [Aeromonas veronii]
TALLTQTGSRNQIDSEQRGSEDLLTITQNGNENIANARQSGTGETAVVTQLGNGNQADTNQQGSGNTAQVTQNGSNNQAVVDQLASSVGGSVTIDQLGSDNYANAVQEEGSRNKVDIDQNGTGNQVAAARGVEGKGAWTWGSDNELVVAQKGTDNWAYADASHSDSVVTVTQDGKLNSAKVESYLGSDNTLTVSQFGEKHVANVYVNGGMGGGNNEVDVAQTDSLNTANVTVYGSDNMAYVYQGSGSN